MQSLRDMSNKQAPDDWSELYKIQFEFNKVKKGRFNVFYVNNIITWDTESSNGFKLKNSNNVIGMNQLSYDRGAKKVALSPDDYDKNDPDIIHYLEISDADPVGLVYVWSCAIESGDGTIKVFAGRTLEDFKTFKLNLSTEILRQKIYGFKSINRALENSRVSMMKQKPAITTIVFVHNLGHDWHFLRNIFNDHFTGRKNQNVFARQMRKPMKAVMRFNGIKWEYRDTVILSQKALKTWAKDTPSCPLSKLDDFDYLTIKTPDDILTPEEWHYIVNDTMIMIYCLEYERRTYKTTENIPLTQTGKVRRILYDKVCKTNPAWAQNCVDITLRYTPDEFRKRVALYKGGYTHGNAIHVGNVGEVTCFDFASSYPSVLTSTKYPVEGYEIIDTSEFDKMAAQDPENPEYRWFAQIKLTGVKSTLTQSNWSSSKCTDLTGLVVDNGRIRAADTMTIWADDFDWYIFKQAYAWQTIEILELQAGRADYLPKEMIMTILDYYGKKTTLKGIDDRESEYNEAKQFINSIYGLMVYKLICDMIGFNGQWFKLRLDDPTANQFDAMFWDELNDATKTKEGEIPKMSGTYDMGITVASAARKRLWDFIVKFDAKIWYCDTDSIKGQFDRKDLKWIETYNTNLMKRQNDIADMMGFDRELYNPKDQKGIPHRLGMMVEDDYKRNDGTKTNTVLLKTLGAKRYMTKTDDGATHITLAGCPKIATEIIKDFDDFKIGYTWTTEQSHKVECHYNEEQGFTRWTGRDGKVFLYDGEYGVCLKPTTFEMSRSNDFIEFLDMIATGRIFDIDQFDRATPDYLWTK